MLKISPWTGWTVDPLLCTACYFGSRIRYTNGTGTVWLWWQRNDQPHFVCDVDHRCAKNESAVEGLGAFPCYRVRSAVGRRYAWAGKPIPQNLKPSSCRVMASSISIRWWPSRSPSPFSGWTVHGLIDGSRSEFRNSPIRDGPGWWGRVAG